MNAFIIFSPYLSLILALIIGLYLNKLLLIMVAYDIIITIFCLTLYLQLKNYINIPIFGN